MPKNTNMSRLTNANTLLALQIIQPENHPNPFNQGPGTTGSKESLSLYGLFYRFARSPQGRARLRQYFLRPTLDLNEISCRQDFISVFVRPDNFYPFQKLSKSMSKIKDMRSWMTLLRQGVVARSRTPGAFRSGVWASLLEFTHHAIQIRFTLRDVIGAESLPLYGRAMDVLDHIQLDQIYRLVGDRVDLELSIEARRTVIKRDIDHRLDEIKDLYNGLERLLSRVAHEIKSTLPNGVFTPDVLYIPQIGFLLSVPVNQATGQPVYSGGSPQWQRKFSTKDAVYFKDRRMHEMDEQLGDVYHRICGQCETLLGECF